MAPPINVQDWYGDRHTCQIASGALGYRSCQTFLEKLFLCKFASQIVCCCYLELLKSYKALKVSERPHPH